MCCLMRGALYSYTTPPSTSTNCRLINFRCRFACFCLSLPPAAFFLLFLPSFSPWPGSANPIIITMTINMIYCRLLSVVYSFPRHRFFSSSFSFKSFYFIFISFYLFIFFVILLFFFFFFFFWGGGFSFGHSLFGLIVSGCACLSGFPFPARFYLLCLSLSLYPAFLVLF